MTDIIFNRIWAMPNGKTFRIKPIKELVERYVYGCVVDPFANEAKYGNFTNDLSVEFETTHHMDALDFLKSMETGIADVVLYDPPYSMRQASELYKSVGKEKLTATVTSMKYWSDCKIEIARICKLGGTVISCGWNTNGIGINRGFDIIEILIVPHGGSKNDTTVTVEYKLR